MKDGQYRQYWDSPQLQREAIQPAIEFAKLWPIRQEYDKDFRTAREATGRVSFRKHPTLPLGIFCYVPSLSLPAMKPHEAFVRGLVLELGTGKIISWPMGKMAAWRSDDLPSNARLEKVVEKIDGSLLVVARYGDNIIVTTKGAFTNEYTDFVYSNPLMMDTVKDIPENETWMYELYLPSDSFPKAVDYGKEPQLIKLMERDNATGQLKTVDTLPVYDFKYLYQIREYFNTVSEENREGVVAWVADNGQQFPVKIKTGWYLSQTFRGRPVRVKDFVAFVIANGFGLVEYFESVGVYNDPELHPMYNELMEAESTIQQYIEVYTQLYNDMQHLDVSSFSDFLSNVGLSKKAHSPLYQFRKVGGDEYFWRKAAAKRLLGERF